MAAAATTTTPIPTAFVALTSIFTPPSRCSNSWTYEPSEFNGQPSGLFVQNAIGGEFDTRCWPTGFTHAGRNEKGATVQVYSPGYCPVGYTTALLAPGDTTSVTCCQSGFSYTFSSATAGERAAGGLAGCISTFSSDRTTTVIARPSMTLTPNTLLVTSTLDGAALGKVTMWAQAITIAYQQKDLALFTTSSSSATSSSARRTASSSATPASGSSTPLSGTSPADSSSGLSTGAKAGIGVGVALGALILLGALLFLLFRRRRKNQSSQPYESNQYAVNEMDGTSRPTEMSQTAHPPTKVEPGRVHELPGNEGRYA